MSTEYSTEVIRELEAEFQKAELHRPMRVARYEPGTELEYDIDSTLNSTTARVKLLIEKFIGGGFAGQVYRVRILEINPEAGSTEKRWLGKAKRTLLIFL